MLREFNDLFTHLQCRISHIKIKINKKAIERSENNCLFCESFKPIAIRFDSQKINALDKNAQAII